MSDSSENSAFSFVDMEHQILSLWEETDAQVDVEGLVVIWEPVGELELAVDC